MTFTHLTTKQLEAIRAAFKSANIGYDAGTRATMFSSIASEYLDSLKNLDNNTAQLVRDLDRLNSTKKYGEQVPLETWLKNGRDIVFAGREEEIVFQQTIEDLASHPAQRPDTQMIETLITTLREKLQEDSDASYAVSRYKDIFEQARREIALITDCKDLHEHLHNLQMAWPEEIDDEARRRADPKARLNLRKYSRLLTNVVPGLKKILDNGNVKPEDLKPVFGGQPEAPAYGTWVAELDYHQQRFDDALNNDNAGLLVKTFDIVKGGLPTALSNLNDKLKEAVDGMRLDHLIDALTKVCSVLKALDAERTAEQVKMYESGVNELTTLGQRLRELRKQHDDWQGVDLRLGMLDSILEDAGRASQMGTYLVTVHNSLVKQIEPLYGESAANWAIDLRDSTKNMKDSLDKQDEAVAAEWFQIYRAQATLRFYILDSEMKTQCDELGKVGDRLEKLNDDLENM